MKQHNQHIIQINKNVGLSSYEVTHYKSNKTTLLFIGMICRFIWWQDDNCFIHRTTRRHFYLAVWCVLFEDDKTTLFNYWHDVLLHRTTRWRLLFTTTHHTSKQSPQKTPDRGFFLNPRGFECPFPHPILHHGAGSPGDDGAPTPGVGISSAARWSEGRRMLKKYDIDLSLWHDHQLQNHLSTISLPTRESQVLVLH